MVLVPKIQWQEEEKVEVELEENVLHQRDFQHLVLPQAAQQRTGVLLMEPLVIMSTINNHHLVAGSI